MHSKKAILFGTFHKTPCVSTGPVNKREGSLRSRWRESPFDAPLACSGWRRGAIAV